MENKKTQQLPISTNSTSTLLKQDKKKPDKPPTLLSISPSYVVMHHPTLHTSIECCNFYDHPFLTVNMFHIIYKQTKFPTQPHKSP